MTRTSSLLAILSALAACAPAGEAPDSVARRFWAAIGAGQLSQARALSTASDAAGLRELAERHPFARVELGRVLRNEDSALVETTALLEGARQTEIAFNTHLTRFEDGWRVESDETRREVVRASLAATLEDVQTSLRASAELLSETIERGALEFSEALRQAIEDAERDLRGAPPPGP